MNLFYKESKSKGGGVAELMNFFYKESKSKLILFFGGWGGGG